ncbi:MAG: prepilin-type N-terminal cleavage/methylation domain-containing protein [Acholeplasmatales bacterium]|nr:MAG: prepilin-type N-terminal cleavage/methylation domain-containing protein [Acholeplasmatales bacterium]
MIKKQTRLFHAPLRATSGFTLIELIVSIAIIAILAAVLIPTVSGFIFRAQLSADRTEVAAINHALMAYEIDGTLKKPTNLFEARALLEDITDGQFRNAPRTSRRGYHFWFDLEASRLVLFDVDGLISYYAENPANGNAHQLSTDFLTPLTTNRTLDADRFSATVAARPEGFLYTAERPVILVQTSGSPTAHALDWFYRVETLEDYQHLYAALNHSSLSPVAYAHLKNLFDATVFITESGMFRQHHQPAQQAVFADGVSLLRDYVIDRHGHVQVLGVDAPLFDLRQDITLPASINHIPANALMVSDTHSPHQFVFNRSLEAIAEIVEAGFTNHQFRGLSQNYRLHLDDVTGKADNIRLAHRHEPLLETPLFSPAEMAENHILHYVFDEQFPLHDFHATFPQHWRTSYDGLTGRHGLYLFENHSRDYTITVRASLDATDGPQNTRTTGGFGVLIETKINDQDNDTGLAIQFDRGLGGVSIRTRENGQESRVPVLLVQHADNPLIPESRRDAWWTDTVEMRLDVRTLDVTNNLMTLDVYLNGEIIIAGFVFETFIDDATQNKIAFRAWTVPTLFHSLTIEQSVPVAD